MLPFLDGPDLVSLLPMPAAIDALERALRAGLDPGGDPARSSVGRGDAELLLMPSAAAGGFVVKLVTIAPGNPDLGRPRIQGVVAVFDPETHAPVAMVDGIALTAVRTPAVSALAAKYVAGADAQRLVVFGTGPQAAGHITALRLLYPSADVAIVGRDFSKAESMADQVGARVGTAGEVAAADVIVCATTARDPVFDGELVRDGACVIAVGSHEPDARELDAPLVQRSRVVVEDVFTALRTAGDLVLAGIAADVPEPLDRVVRNEPMRDPRRPTVVKTVGMAWEDAVIARAAIDRWLGGAGSGEI